ncbi:MAG: hypothetical protein E7Z93_00345 [Cyanobacteria bacterium SIG32]|nr:hypothetical protein [Cyanobacteria bacterium SIG32]
MVEFLPLCEFDNNSNSNNYWGYMTLRHFAPVKRYAFDKTAGGALKEFRKMIKEFHKEDIKVCMDVVYNHTGEIAPNNDDINDVRQFSYSLIDNQMYYKQKNGKYNSNSDCKNDINSAEEETMELIADSIAYWANQGVDAFRFDLAVGLMDIDKTEQVNYNPNESLIGKLSEMLKEKGVKVNRPEESGNGIYLIAEPWTCKGANSYQIGKFPDVWAQWNDIARETFKNDSLNPFSSTPSKLRHVIEGTHGIFPNGDKSINYTHSHDGYTLYDNNSIEKRNNDWHFASNYNEDKNRQLMAIKKQIALTLLAKGTPMLQIGDMIGHSKSGDCNSYNQDNETNYLDFSKTKNKNSTEGNIYDFTQKMINFRKKHPVLRSSEFNKNITYYKPDGSFAQPYDNDYWNTNHINTLSYKIEDKNSLFISSSSNDNLVGIKLPQNQNGKKWNLVCDTSLKNSFFDKNVPIENDYYLQNAHSIIILEER